MIWLLACTQGTADSGTEPIEGQVYAGPVVISAAGLDCVAGFNAVVTTDGVADGARLSLPEGDEEHALRLTAVDPAGWWSTWAVTLQPSSSYVPGVSTQAQSCAVPFSTTVTLDGEDVDTCGSDDTC